MSDEKDLTKEEAGLLSPDDQTTENQPFGEDLGDGDLADVAGGDNGVCGFGCSLD